MTDSAASPVILWVSELVTNYLKTRYHARHIGLHGRHLFILESLKGCLTSCQPDCLDLAIPGYISLRF